MRHPRQGGAKEGVSMPSHLHLIFSQNIGNREILVLFILRSEEQGPVEFAVRQPPYCNFVLVSGGEGDLVDFVGFLVEGVRQEGRLLWSLPNIDREFAIVRCCCLDPEFFIHFRIQDIWVLKM